METRANRLVENEEAFRAANDELLRAAAGKRSIVAFLCECADDTCLARIDLDVRVYREIRSDPRHFFRLPGHLTAPGEEVVANYRGYEVVDRGPRSVSADDDTGT